jgi:hypothetical protein
MFLSAGYGMNYSPGPDGHEMFTNVFVQRWAFNIGRHKPQSEHRRTHDFRIAAWSYKALFVLTCRLALPLPSHVLHTCRRCNTITL